MLENPISSVPWHSEFARIIRCNRCDAVTDKNLLRDELENVPQPGYIGTRYESTRLLLIGQNPALPSADLKSLDREYTAALRIVRDKETLDSYAKLQEVLSSFIPSWPVHGQYFPLAECSLTLEEIAYCNLVRCRTRRVAGSYKAPHDRTAAICRSQHLERWLELLAPRAVVFIGLWPSQLKRGGKSLCDAKGIPSEAVNRDKFMTPEQRAANRSAVIQFVRRHLSR